MAGFLVRGRVFTTTPVFGVVSPGGFPPLGRLSWSLIEVPGGQGLAWLKVSRGGRSPSREQDTAARGARVRATRGLDEDMGAMTPRGKAAGAKPGVEKP